MKVIKYSLEYSNLDLRNKLVLKLVEDKTHEKIFIHSQNPDIDLIHCFLIEKLEDLTEELLHKIYITDRNSMSSYPHIVIILNTNKDLRVDKPYIDKLNAAKIFLEEQDGNIGFVCIDLENDNIEDLVEYLVLSYDNNN